MLILVTLLFNIFSYGVAVSAETFPKDPGNIYNDLTGNYGLLRVAGQFHVFAKNKAAVNAHTDGNIATCELDVNSNFETELRGGLLNQEINYIQKTDSFVNSLGIPTDDTRVNKSVVDGDVDVALRDGHPTVNGSGLDHLTPDDFYKDRDDNGYIDFEQEFARLNVAANDPTTATPGKTYTAADSPDMNDRTADLTGLSDCGFLLVNIDAEVLTMGAPLQIINPGGQVVVFNVVNSSSALNVQLPIKYNGRSNHETEDFSDASISWDFGNEITDLTISAPFQGTILAPNVTTYITQNQDGTTIGTNMILDAATDRWDPNEIFISDDDASGTGTTSTSDSTDTTTSGDSSDSTTTNDSTNTTATSDSTDSTATSSDSTDSTTTSDSTDTAATSDSTGTMTSSDSSDTTSTSDSTDTATTNDGTDSTTTSGDSTDSITTSDSIGTTTASDSTDSTTTSDSTGTTTSGDSSDSTTTSDSTDTAILSDNSGTASISDSTDATISSDSTGSTTTNDSTDTTTTSDDSSDFTAIPSDSIDTVDITFITSDSRHTNVSFPRASSDNKTSVNLANKTSDGRLNKSKKVLPKTGSQSNNWITIAGAILFVIGLRITLMSNKGSKG